MDNTYLLLCIVASLCLVVSTFGCDCPRKCVCSPGEATCTDITNFPTCLPSGVSSLIVKNSTSMTNITSIPNGITTLSVQNTGLNNVDPNALSDATSLQSLTLSGNSALESLNFGTPTSNSKLKNLRVTDCMGLKEVKNLKHYTSLTDIKISSTGISEICEETFEDLENVENLDISANPNLRSIDEEAFEDLDSLQTLDMSNCSLETLYGEYFDNAYHKQLKSVNALFNPYKCLTMCDFMQWYWNHRPFFNYALIGTCTIPASNGAIYVYPSVYTLNRYEAGCPPIVGIIIGATLGAFFFICLAACIFVFVCGIDYRKYCCFCCESNRNREMENSSQRDRNNRDENDLEHAAYDPNAEKINLQGPYYSAAPPSYEDITGSASPAQMNTVIVGEQTET